MTDPLAAAYAGRRVLVTGHTGFCGAWLSLWLHELGARVHGLALAPPTRPSLHDQLGLDGIVASSTIGDVRDAGLVADVVAHVEPEVVLHLAAQPLVLASLADPVGTFATNVMGTAHVLDALRRTPTAAACVVVTTDKCYRPGPAAHREGDPLGGHDPYSASKAGAELVVDAYRASLLPAGVGLASARAGNVIGGGDWAADRLVPDCARALAAGEAVVVRDPGAIRPWQHVLDALAGYLLLAARLLDDPVRWAGPWNLGPGGDGVTVAEVVATLGDAWAREGVDVAPPVLRPRAATVEAPVLRLDATQAATRLGWRPRLDVTSAVEWTAAWYAACLVRPAFDARATTADQLARFAALPTSSIAPTIGAPA